MPSIIMSSTGLARQAREQIRGMAEDMGASYEHVLTHHTTHLVCVMAKGSKYEAATRPPLLGRVKIITPAYVRLCHASVTRLDEEEYLTPVLSKISVSISGFESTCRDAIRELVLAAGGAYSSALEKGTTDVLIVAKPAGPKYEAAATWSVPCVSRQWLEDSVACGHNLSVLNYELKQDDRKINHKRKWDDNGMTELRSEICQACDSDVFDNMIAFVHKKDFSDGSIDVLLSRGQGTCLPIDVAATHILIPSSVAHTGRHDNNPPVVQAGWVAETSIKR